ncbi:hypothetical protein [Rubritalea profundi]|uniref:Uncharacterized protein n=1 Tax=Rubritalea profundi TaxID=1658618 RepID=A0A2S7U5Z4_9BACT|nr:hypothetical protein [Rubritalea profundi]PQJ29814.1 hypothetical protein BSZ32_15890 [Rubritalea profundi]
MGNDPDDWNSWSEESPIAEPKFKSSWLWTQSLWISIAVVSALLVGILLGRGFSKSQPATYNTN